MRVLLCLVAAMAMVECAYRAPPRGPPNSPGPYGPPGPYAPHAPPHGPYAPPPHLRKPRPVPYSGKVRRQPPPYHPNYYHQSAPVYPQYSGHSSLAAPGPSIPQHYPQPYSQPPPQAIPQPQPSPHVQQLPQYHSQQITPSLQLPQIHQQPQSHQIPQNHQVQQNHQLPQSHQQQPAQPYSYPLHFAQPQQYSQQQYSQQLPQYPNEYEGFGQLASGSSPAVAQLQLPQFQITEHNNPIHTVPAPKLSPADRPAAFAHHVPSYIKESHLLEDPSSYKSHSPSYFAPDPDPQVPTLTVPPTKDPHSIPTNGQVPLDLYLQQQAEAANSGAEQNSVAEQGERLSEQELFKLLNYQPELATNTIPQLYPPLYVPQTYSFQGYDSHHAASETVSEAKNNSEETVEAEEENDDEIMKSAEASVPAPTRPAREVSDQPESHDRQKRF